MPMYLSTCGRSIWSDEPFKVTVKNGEFIIDGNNVILEKHGDTLKDAFLGAMKKHFSPSGEKLPEEYDKLFLRNEKGEIALSYWWKGHTEI